jgi:uroporphyrinogen decarboxylase
MDYIERFYNTIYRKPVDRPCTWLGIPDSKAIPQLLKFFNASNPDDLIRKLDDDIRPVELPYRSPVSNAIYAAFDFSKKDAIDIEHRTLTAPGYFADCENVEQVESFDWPDPNKYIDRDECSHVVMKASDGRIVLGVLWSAHFQDACAAFGMEDALIKMHTFPELFHAVIDRILKFYLQANEIFYESTNGMVHAVLIGNDFGAQTGLLLSPELIRKFVLPGTAKLVAQAKQYNLKVIHHSCGSIIPIINDLIDIGVDIIHPIQALAKGMEPERLKKDYGTRVSFCGGVDAQNLLVNGSEQDVRREVKKLINLFPTGLIVSPSHEAILPDIPPANIKAIFDTVRQK